MTTPQDARHVDFSDRFVLSSGTVAIDCRRSLVLLLYYRPKGEYLLPKGRKNVGETLEAAAERETWEESGYNCRLLSHSLPTRAPQPTRTPHTEPIAVQQRFSQGIRKIIFWYLAQVDSSDRQAVQTQEEGEDFEVRWVCTVNAPSTMSFVEDREIVEKALSAVSCPLQGSVRSIFPLRDWFLDLSVDVRALGFSASPLEVAWYTANSTSETLKRWAISQIGTVLPLLRGRKISIEKEECPKMTLPKNSQLRVGWDVLRFSGWTKQGSKRTIKIWSKTSICQIASQAIPSHLGVLSHKVVHFTRRDHPTLGPRLFIYQPTRVTEQLHVLHDFDILEGSEPDLVFSPKGRSYKAVSPGVSCDLFLTSLCIFEREPGVMASFKTAILQKWQLLSRADEMESVIPLFYRGMTFGRSYSQMLREEIREIESNRRNRTSVHGTLERSSITPSNIQISSSFPAKSGSGYSAGYRELYLTPLQQQASELYPEIDISQQVEQLYPIVCEIRDEDTAFTLTRFSSNSSGLYAEILTSASPGWQRVYIKNAASVPDELEALPSVQHYFPKERVQVLAAAQPALQRIFVQRFLGETLNDIRLRYHHDEGPVNGDTRGRSCFSDEWFVNLDLQRARDNLTVYSRTFRLLVYEGQKEHMHVVM